MAIDPKPKNLAEANEFDSLENPISRRPKPGLLRALLEEHYPPGFLSKVVAETIATYLLMFVTCGSAALSAADENKVTKLGASVAGGLIMTVMIYAVAHIPSQVQQGMIWLEVLVAMEAMYLSKYGFNLHFQLATLCQF